MAGPFQTRRQTWKALEIAALLAVALVGLDWKAGNWVVTVVAGCVLLGVAQFGAQISKRHRMVEQRVFRLIITWQAMLGITDPELKIPDLLSWWDIFGIRKANTVLFIMRLHFLVQLFALGFILVRVLTL